MRRQLVMAYRASHFLQMDLEGRLYTLKVHEKATGIAISYFSHQQEPTDKQWGSDLVRSDLAAEFNQISVVNILVQLYSGILAFVLYSSVVDQSALAYLSAQACQVCTTQRDAAGAPHSRLQRWEHTLAWFGAPV